jgi:hypothetical protein
MRTILYQDDWVTLTFDAAVGLVRYERGEKPYGSLAELDACHAALRTVAIPSGPNLKLLIDVRRAPPRNDDGFETKTNAVLPGFLKRFSKHATLVKTAVGKLQTERLARVRGVAAHSFDDERAALEYLGIRGA